MSNHPVTNHEYLDDMHIAVPWTEEEVAEGIDVKILMMAFRELRRYIHEYADLTVNYAQRISLKDYKVKDFLEVRRATTPPGLGVGSPTGSVFASLAGMVPIGGSMVVQPYLDYYTETMLVQNIKNTISHDLQYSWDEQNQLLYISSNLPYPAQVTITYIPYYDDPSEIKTTYWQDWLRRLAIAHFKIYVGEKRSKMRIPNSPVQLNGDALLSEGREELKEIREYLVQNNTPLKIR